MLPSSEFTRVISTSIWRRCSHPNRLHARDIRIKETPRSCFHLIQWSYVNICQWWCDRLVNCTKFNNAGQSLTQCTTWKKVTSSFLAKRSHLRESVIEMIFRRGSGSENFLRPLARTWTGGCKVEFLLACGVRRWKSESFSYEYELRLGPGTSPGSSSTPYRGLSCSTWLFQIGPFGKWTCEDVTHSQPSDNYHRYPPSAQICHLGTRSLTGPLRWT